MMMKTLLPLCASLAVSGVVLAAAQASASKDDVLRALRSGGCVIVMRHASSPGDPPDRQHADAANTTLERQLDQPGRDAATAMGVALRRLKIAVGEVRVSPAYRARETARLAGFGSPTIVNELGDGGRSMQGVTDAQAAWLRAAAAGTPGRGNTLIVTHLPNITRAFPDVVPQPRDGDAIVFRPDAAGGTTVVGRIAIEQWPELK